VSEIAAGRLRAVSAICVVRSAPSATAAAAAEAGELLGAVHP